MLQFLDAYNKGNLGTGFGMLKEMWDQAVAIGNKEGAAYIMAVKESIASFQEINYMQKEWFHTYGVKMGFELKYGHLHYGIFMDSQHNYYIVENEGNEYLVAS